LEIYQQLLSQIEVTIYKITEENGFGFLQDTSIYHFSDHKLAFEGLMLILLLLIYEVELNDGFD